MLGNSSPRFVGKVWLLHFVENSIVDHGMGAFSNGQLPLNWLAVTYDPPRLLRLSIGKEGEGQKLIRWFKFEPTGDGSLHPNQTPRHSHMTQIYDLACDLFNRSQT